MSAVTVRSRMFAGIADLGRSPWAIDSAAADTLQALGLLPAHAQVPIGVAKQLDRWSATVRGAAGPGTNQRSAYIAAGPVAIMTIAGVLSKADADVTDMDGNVYGTSYESLRRSVDMAYADNSIGSILFRIDSPGGAAAPMDSLAEYLFTSSRDPSRGKPFAGLVEDGMGASAAYGLASQASAGLYVTAGASVGSIGTILMALDISGLLDRLGVKVNAIKSTKTKDVGSPFRPMSEGDREVLQAQVNRYDAMFVSAVARGRNVPESRVREWQDLRMLEGKNAVAAGMADGVRSDVYQVIKELAQKYPAKAPRRSAAA